MPRAREIALAIATLALGFAIPAVVLPTVLKLFGAPWFKGVWGVVFSVKMAYIPVPVFLTPDSYAFPGFAMASAFLTGYTLLRQRVSLRTLLRKQVAELVTVLASYIKTGVPVAVALELSANAVEEPMKSYAFRVAKLIRLGHSPFDVFETVFSDVPRDVKVLLSSIPIGVESGGRVAEVLTSAERFSFQLSRMEELRKARLEGYKSILILAVLAYMVSALVTTLLLSYIAKMALATPIAKAAIDLDYVLSLYYISTLIISVITSIAVSRVVYGEVILALKYSAFLTILTTLFFSIASALI